MFALLTLTSNLSFHATTNGKKFIYVLGEWGKTKHMPRKAGATIVLVVPQPMLIW